MIQPKKKKCDKCLEESYIWGRIDGLPYCKPCYCQMKGSTSKSTIKPKPYKATGERELFESIYESRSKRCEVTGDILGEFDVWCFAHILSKKAYPSYRLNPANICMVKREIHLLYDNSSREKLLEAYPQAIIMFDLKDKLRYEYYNGTKKDLSD